MALNPIFKAIIKGVSDSGYFDGDTYGMLGMADAVNEVVSPLVDDVSNREYEKGYTAGRDAEAARHPAPLAQWERELLNAPTHDSLVLIVLGSPLIMDMLRGSRKILAIKELRARQHCSLKAAKDAVEDYRVAHMACHIMPLTPSERLKRNSASHGVLWYNY